MRAAAIDPGTVRVGLAVADELGALAHPRAPLPARDRSALLFALAELATEEEITVFVIGVPFTEKGEEGPAARRARELGRELGERTGAKIVLVDERHSTREARARLREQGLGDREARARIDSAAAAILLQSWLDSNRSEAD